MEKEHDIQGKGMGLNLLLLCGAISSLLYVGSDIAAALSWETYRYAAQSVSELMAHEAPTRPFLVASFIPYNLLVMAFGVGLLKVGGAQRSLRVTGWLSILYGLLGSMGLFLFPLPPPGTESVATDAVHKHEAVTAVMVVCLMAIIGFGATSRGRGFRLYSVATFLTIVLFAILTSMDVPLREANLPTPWMGIKERINIYATMLWILVFSLFLLKERGPKQGTPR